MYKIIFMGTPDFSVSALEEMYNNGYNVVLAVSQPDKPSGRDLKIKPTPVKQYALAHNIEILQPEKIKNNIEFFNKLKKLEPDIIVTAAYGKILPQEILSLPKIACLNIHASLLPKYRGAAPIQWSIINGDKTTGVTIMKMDVGMDTGDIILQKEVAIEDNETYGILYEKLKIIGGKLLIDVLKNIENISPVKQGDNYTMAPMIEKSLGLIDFNKPALYIHNLVRALNPTPGAYFVYDNKTYKVWETSIIQSNSDKKVGEFVFSDAKNGLQIQTSEGILNIKVIQATNSKRMNILDYLRGNKI